MAARGDELVPRRAPRSVRGSPSVARQHRRRRTAVVHHEADAVGDERVGIRARPTVRWRSTGQTKRPASSRVSASIRITASTAIGPKMCGNASVAPSGTSSRTSAATRGGRDRQHDERFGDVPVEGVRDAHTLRGGRRAMDEPFFVERPAERRHVVLAGPDRVVPILLPGDVEDRAGHGDRDAGLRSRRVLLVGGVVGDRLA